MPLMGAVDGDMQPKVNKKRLPNNKSKVKKTAPHPESLSPRESDFQPVSAIIFDRKDLQDKLQEKSGIITGEHGENISPVVSSALPFPASNSQSSEKAAGPRYTFSTDIPEKYDDFYLRALPRDPQWVYVYWELPDGTKGPSEKAIRADSEFAQWILRVKASPSADVKDPSDEHQFDIPINLKDTSSYVKLPEPGYKCNIECGHITNTGKFIPVSSTVPFFVPPPVVKGKIPEESSCDQSQLLIQYSAESAAIKDISHLHEHSKPVSSDQSTNAGERIKITGSESSNNEQIVRYFGSAAPK